LVSNVQEFASKAPSQNCHVEFSDPSILDPSVQQHLSEIREKLIREWPSIFSDEAIRPVMQQDTCG